MKKTVTILLASLLTVIVGCASYEPLVSIRGADVAAADPARSQDFRLEHHAVTRQFGRSADAIHRHV